MMRNPYQSYVEQDVQSGDPLKLVQMLYRGAIDAVSAARVHLRQGAIRERSRQIGKALAIVHELLRSLDRHQEISKSLARLYVYMTKRLIEANAAQSEAPLAEVERLLSTLLEGWRAISPAPAVAEETGAEELDPVSYSY